MAVEILRTENSIREITRTQWLFICVHMLRLFLIIFIKSYSVFVSFRLFERFSIKQTEMLSTDDALYDSVPMTMFFWFSLP